MVTRPRFGDVRDQLEHLPHHHGGNGYLYAEPNPLFPPRAALAKIVQPRSVFEFGALTGYCLCAFVLGAGGSVKRAGWIDDESHTPGSNEWCVENLATVGIHDVWYSETRDDAPGYGKADLVSVDSGHTYEDCIRDLLLSAQLRPRVIVVDDYTADTHAAEIQLAVADFCPLARPADAFQVRTQNGMCVLVLDRRLANGDRSPGMLLRLCGFEVTGL